MLDNPVGALSIRSSVSWEISCISGHVALTTLKTVSMETERERESWKGGLEGCCFGSVISEKGQPIDGSVEFWMRWSIADLFKRTDLNIMAGKLYLKGWQNKLTHDWVNVSYLSNWYDAKSIHANYYKCAKICLILYWDNWWCTWPICIISMFSIVFA